MHRRQFLSRSAPAAVGLALGSGAGCARSRQHTLTGRPAPWKPLVADLEAQIPMLMAEAHVPGVSAVLIQDATVVWQRGFGFSDAHNKAPVDPETIFQAASMSKPAFAYVVLKLCEKGIIELDTPLTKYGAEPFLSGDDRMDRITPRTILSHCSGLPNFRSHDAPLSIGFEPGSQYGYSGEGYFYLQSVVTHLTGKTDRDDCASFEADLRVCATDIGEFLEENLLVPFGMRHSRYVVDEAIERQLATGHDENGQPLERRRPGRPAITRYAAMGGLQTTPTDYAKFMIEILHPRKPDRFRLGSKSLREMLRPHIRVPGDLRPSSWGLGWQIQDDGLVKHGGDNRGFHCQAIASRESASGFVVMTNGENGWKIIPRLMGLPAFAPFLGVAPESP
jgi:CubicO group peptidase (beta-lactamase class C family)